jgi:phage shock protein A
MTTTENLQEQLDTCRELRNLDKAEIVKLQKLVASRIAILAAVQELANKQLAEIAQLRGHKEEADRHIKTIAELRQEKEQLRRTIAFFASVIKSGEPWTEQCQHEYDRAVCSSFKATECKKG